MIYPVLIKPPELDSIPILYILDSDCEYPLLELEMENAEDTICVFTAMCSILTDQYKDAYLQGYKDAQNGDASRFDLKE